MPRKSAASLTIASPVELRRLPPPPGDLTDYQAGLWHQIVATKPSDWWDAANLPLLRALVVHESSAAVIDGQLATFEPEWLKDDDGLRRFKMLSQIRAEHTAKVESLMTKMRLTQQSRYGAREATTAARRAGKSPKPWDK
jgi:hypothetical protein